MCLRPQTQSHHSQQHLEQSPPDTIESHSLIQAALSMWFLNSRISWGDNTELYGPAFSRRGCTSIAHQTFCMQKRPPAGNPEKLRHA